MVTNDSVIHGIMSFVMKPKYKFATTIIGLKTITENNTKITIMLKSFILLLQLIHPMSQWLVRMTSLDVCFHDTEKRK